MRTALLRSSLLALVMASSASAVTMDWTPIGNPGNACDPQAQGCFGAVGYNYKIGTYEVTNAQYAEFLNAKAAAADPLALWSEDPLQGGISRSGNLGSYTYTAKAGWENKPVNYISFYEALRFANWMNNGQGSGDTETGAYTLLGGTTTPSNGTTVTRNAGATIFLTNENEWYKAAYYDSLSTSYFDYPAGSDAQTTCSAPTSAPNSANCSHSGSSGLTEVGAYAGSASPYGTFDQGGNVIEWNEEIGSPPYRLQRGGAYYYSASSLAASVSQGWPPSGEANIFGFRIAMIPEPSTALLVIAGLLGLAGWRRGRD